MKYLLLLACACSCATRHEIIYPDHSEQSPAWFCYPREGKVHCLDFAAFVRYMQQQQSEPAAPAPGSMQL